DGAKLAFSAQVSAGGPFAVYTANADGSHIRRVTHGPRDNLRPAWSPDGTTLAFARIRDNGRSIVLVVDLNRRFTIQMSKGLATATEPSWSPDGTELAFAGRQLIGSPTICGDLCRWQIFTVDPGGGSLRQVTSLNHGLRAPDWSPDGSRFVA